MFSDFTLIFYWWVLVFGLGVTCLPVCLFFFQKFFDQAYALAKIVAILLVSYLVWLLGSLRILPFFSETIWLVILLVGVFNFWLARRQKLDFKKIFKKNGRIWLLEEGLFFASLTFWVFVRGYQPNIHGLEKFMDFGFVNSILRARFFPPLDMWLAGETINYYYFGHFTAALLTKLSGLDSAITYNLLIATLCGLTLSAAFCLGGNLVTPVLKKRKQIVFFALLAAGLVTFGGNLHLLYWWTSHRNFSGYWYPDATRFIVEKFGAADNTIHEFPIYSFVVADLHGHLLNLPFVLLFLSLLLAIFLRQKISLLLSCSLALLLGIFYMTNTWDFAIYGLVYALVLFLLTFIKSRLRLVKAIQKTLSFGLVTLFGAILFSLPFHLHFQPLSQGIGLVNFHSPLWMLPVLWGWPLFLTLNFAVFRWRQKTKLLATDWFVFTLLVVSWLLIILPEFIYNKDIYIHSHQRANTMFKLTYQAFVMFGICAGYILLRFSKNLKIKPFQWAHWLVAGFFLIFIFLYPYFATRSYYGLTTYLGLDGLTYLKGQFPNDYQAIIWLRKYVKGQPVIVEAVGESYTDYARVSANTGLPTLLGWRVHEWLWRGSFDEAGRRTEEVRQIYEAPNSPQALNLLNQYQVKYIFVGALERQQYLKLQEEKIAQLGKPVFTSGQTTIYKINY